MNSRTRQLIENIDYEVPNTVSISKDALFHAGCASSFR